MRLNQHEKCALAAQAPDGQTATRFVRRCHRRYGAWLNLVAIATLILVACGPEDMKQIEADMTVLDSSSTVYDDQTRQLLLELLENSSVEYELDGQTIRYSHTDKEYVDEMFGVAAFFPSIQFLFFELSQAEYFVDVLKDRGVVTRIILEDDDQYVVKVPPEHYDEANKLKAEIVFQRSNYQGATDAS